MARWREYIYVLATVWVVIGAIFLLVAIIGDALGLEVVLPVYAAVTVTCIYVIARRR